MAIFSKVLLSGSTNGRPIGITGTATGSANTIHTAIAGTSSLDEIWLYASNNGSQANELTIEWGDSGDLITFLLQQNSGLYTIAPGLLLQNSLVVKGYCDTASYSSGTIEVYGFVNRIA